jgi:hypothetical protein
VCGSSWLMTRTDTSSDLHKELEEDRHRKSRFGREVEHGCAIAMDFPQATGTRYYPASDQLGVLTNLS